MTDTRRFTGRQITTMVVVLGVAIVLAPAGAVAASNAFSISDPSHPSHQAHVSSTGGLAVTTQDGTTGTRAKIDKSGHTVVGDGSGALTVDGKVSVSGSKVSVSGGSVNVSGSVRTYAPASTWHFSPQYTSTYYDVTPPRTDAVNLTNLFLGGDHTTDYMYAAIYAGTVPASATTSCQASATDSDLLWQGEVGGAARATVPVSETFVTPLQARPTKGHKVCLFAYVNKSGGMLFNASGYYGG